MTPQTVGTVRRASGFGRPAARLSGCPCSPARLSACAAAALLAGGLAACGDDDDAADGTVVQVSGTMPDGRPAVDLSPIEQTAGRDVVMLGDSITVASTPGLEAAAGDLGVQLAIYRRGRAPHHGRELTRSGDRPRRRRPRRRSARSVRDRARHERHRQVRHSGGVRGRHQRAPGSDPGRRADRVGQHVPAGRPRGLGVVQRGADRRPR